MSQVTKGEDGVPAAPQSVEELEQEVSNQPIPYKDFLLTLTKA